jgi:hypothetical protein
LAQSLGAFGGQSIVYDLLAGHQSLAAKVVFEQPSLVPDATRKTRCFYVQKIVGSVYTNITGVHVITGICSH